MKGTGIRFPGRNTSERHAGAAYGHHSGKKKTPLNAQIGVIADPEKIRRCLDRTEYYLTEDIDFVSYMG